MSKNSNGVNRLKAGAVWPYFLLIVVAALVVYGQMLVAPPITWDDDSNIFKNPYYAAKIWSHFWQDNYFGLYVPVTSTVWQVLYTLGEHSPLPFRVMNLCLHLANGFLLWQLLRSLSARWGLQSKTAIVAGVALFLLHPLQDQAVNWISGGRDVLSAFFAFSSIYIFFRFANIAGGVGATLLFALAVLSKPNSVVLAALLPGLVYVIEPRRFKKSLLWAGLWLIPAGFSIYMTLHAQADFLVSLQWWERLLIAGDTYTFYIQKLIFPYPLSANYDRQPAHVLSTWGPYWRCASLLILTIPFFKWAWREDKRFLLALSWFALLLPVSGVVAFGYQKISTTANHYHYLPMAAVALLLMLAVSKWPQWEKWAKVILPLFIVGLSLMANARAQVWKNDVNFFENMADYTSDSYSAALGLSVVRCAQQNNFEEGVRWTQIALNERPLDILALANQAYCYLHAKEYRKVVELELYLPKLDLHEMEFKQPTAYSSFLASVGTGLFETGDMIDGFQFLCEAYRVMPSDANHKRNLEIGHALLQKNKLKPECVTPFPGAKFIPEAAQDP